MIVNFLGYIFVIFIMKSKKSLPMAKKQTKIIVKSTKEGKLFIEPSELFALESVQDLIKRVVQSKALSDTKRVAIK